MLIVSFALVRIIIAFVRRSSPLGSAARTGLCDAHGRKKEGNVLFNDARNTFYSRLYGVGHMVNEHSNSER